MSFIIVHHAFKGRNLNHDDANEVGELLAYLDFIGNEPITGSYFGSSIVFEDALDPEFEISLFRYQDEIIHEERLYLLFEMGISLKELVASPSPLWDRVICQVNFHRHVGAGELLNCYGVDNTIVVVMESSAAMEQVVAAQMGS